MLPLRHRDPNRAALPHKQTWLPREERLCSHCDTEIQTELHFLTSRPGCPGRRGCAPTATQRSCTSSQADLAARGGEAVLPLRHRDPNRAALPHKQTWLPGEERLCSHCDTEIQTELHFLTSRPGCPGRRGCAPTATQRSKQSCTSSQSVTNTNKLDNISSPNSKNNSQTSKTSQTQINFKPSWEKKCAAKTWPISSHLPQPEGQRDAL